jgi:hypothetical protein
MDDEEIRVPAAFWRRLSDEQMHDIMFTRSGRLNAEECALLWRVLKRRDKPPKAFTLTTLRQA